MKSHREQSTFALHTREAGCEFDFRGGKGMTCVESSVHVGIGHCAKEFGVLFSNFGGGDAV
jgi:hypothetical protein